ncbi:DUF7601 domain-containing protein [Lacrimispora sp.]|uniref:DUF7601 domain-containing protein n=1 Tax=Lacrimispora sp. TaxID=2719234 RepID=UPI00285FACBE|nr:hypothetical protein [Lacrimispora sp.]MDR7811823.1 hypothetical protein [Lacrimispora sp.]
MKKKSNELRGRLSAMALAVVMCMGTVISAFAAGDPIFGTEDAPAAAAITKNLIMPVGTTTPDATFTFQFSPVSVDDRTTPGDLDTMPTVGPTTIAFTASDIGTDIGTVPGTDIVGFKTILKQSGDVLSGVSFPHAGVYVYNIVENSSVTGYTPGDNETYVFSPAQYALTVYVKNGVNGLYVAAVASSITVNDSSNQTSDPGDKVDPTPQPGDPNITGNYSKIMFTNTYSKTAGGVDPTDPNNHVLTIGKAVSGDYADRTKYFAFQITATQPGVVQGSATYKAYVLDSGNNVVTSEDNTSNLQTDGNDYSYIEFTSGVTETVNLKHDQKLVFTDLHIGAKYVAVESAVEYYTASALVVENGGGPIQIFNSLENLALSTGTKLIGENANSAAFTNTYRTITPTGVIINNLPFVMILVLAAGAFAAFVVIKSRKKRNYVPHR